MKKLERPYILLTPGPLTTTDTVRMVMLKDWCTWDSEYNNLVEDLRRRVLSIGVKSSNDEYTTVLMQGSGTFVVESVIGSAVKSKGDKILVIGNGVYGSRIKEIADVLNLESIFLNFGEKNPVDLSKIEETLKNNTDITHVAIVHCETTTGRLNPIKSVGKLAKKYNKIYIVDAMSSYGGIEIDIADIQIDFMISSSNKCIQGVPGFGFVIAKKSELEKCKGNAKSLSLDLYSQWDTMEKGKVKWRFTSPTHVVRAFHQALIELEQEGGVKEREKRYRENHKILVDGLEKIGFKTLVEKENQAPIITTFYSPQSPEYTFEKFYNSLKEKGFVIYPGKVTDLDTFRIGNIGDIYPQDIKELVLAIEKIKN